MAQADANRQAIKPRVRERVDTLVSDLDALTFTAGGATGPEVEALRDALADALTVIFGSPES